MEMKYLRLKIFSVQIICCGFKQQQYPAVTLFGISQPEISLKLRKGYDHIMESHTRKCGLKYAII